MKIICKSRGGGKTTELIEEAKKLKGYNLIVCKDRHTVHELWKIILEKEHNLPQPISFDEFIEGKYYGPNINVFLIDDADILIQYISKGVRIHAITFTNKKEELNLWHEL